MNSMVKKIHPRLPACCILVAFFFNSLCQAQIRREIISGSGDFIVIEFLNDSLIHFACGHGAPPDAGTGIETTPMVSKKDHPGPKNFTKSGDGLSLETRNLKLLINKSTLSIALEDKTKANGLLTSFQPQNLGADRKALVFTRESGAGFYGLGQQFTTPNKSDANWNGCVREGGEFGNDMLGFNDGANGNTQIPVLYVVNGVSFENYAVFLDNVYKQKWDFTGTSQWKVETAERSPGGVRFYMLCGPNLPSLRKCYMDLVGRPPVPPKKMFGLWISEYGYDSWKELENKLGTLRANKFPVDGFVLDLQWFGGIKPGSDDTRMGTLSWAPDSFPNASSKLSFLRDTGIGIMTIEEAYIGKNLPEHATLAAKGFLVKDKPGSSAPAYFTGNPWWGKGGMLDYTNDSCGDYWHDTKRTPLINAGVIAHWTDLNEPELIPLRHASCPGSYHIGGEADAHNLFAFKWVDGIYRGYHRNNVSQRPFIMSRSGTAGIQRFGAAMWSGDIGRRLSSLVAHWGNQAHMSLSGIDYYGADIGGFRGSPEGDNNELFTQWFAYGMLFDVPGRTHTENLCNCRETAPDRIGDVPSNLDNARLRYAVSPYLYSLAHSAYTLGEPVMPPLFYYYQTDAAVRSMGDEKMIGRSLLAAPAAKHGQTQRDVYLPAGTWYDWYSHQKMKSAGVYFPNVPLRVNERFRVPLYARAGAIIPMMHVDDKTMNILGKRTDGSARSELIVSVFPVEADKAADTFALFEDDGVSNAYQTGQVRTTVISQTRKGATITVAIAAAKGAYAQAPSSRNNVVALAWECKAKSVKCNASALPKLTSTAAFDKADSGWIEAGGNTIMAKSGNKAVNKAKKFSFSLDTACVSCKSQFLSIAVPGEGNGWNPADPARTLKCKGGGVWNGQIALECEQYKFIADGSWNVNWGSDGKRNGPNFTAPAFRGLYDVTFYETDPAHPKLFCIACDTNQVSVKFICENGQTVPGISVYVVGNVEKLGKWDPKKAIKLNPDGPYPKWTGLIGGLPAATAIEWKCIKRQEGQAQEATQWESGENHKFTTPASGYCGEKSGAF